VPPSISPKKAAASSISHVLIKVHAKPKVEMKRKLRYQEVRLSAKSWMPFELDAHVQLLLSTEHLHIFLILQGPLILATPATLIIVELMVLR